MISQNSLYKINVAKELSEAKRAPGEAVLPFNTIQIFSSRNTIEFRITQNSQPLNEQCEQTAEGLWEVGWNRLEGSAAESQKTREHDGSLTLFQAKAATSY